MAEGNQVVFEKLTLNQLRQAEESAKANPDTPASKREERKEARLQRQIERETKRGRLSWKTKQALEERALNQFAQSLLQEKTTNAKIQDSQPSAQENQQLSTTRTQDFSSIQLPPPPSRGSVPQNLPSEIVEVCIDGRRAEMQIYGGVIRFLD